MSELAKNTVKLLRQSEKYQEAIKNLQNVWNLWAKNQDSDSELYQDTWDCYMTIIAYDISCVI